MENFAIDFVDTLLRYTILSFRSRIEIRRDSRQIIHTVFCKPVREGTVQLSRSYTCFCKNTHYMFFLIRYTTQSTTWQEDKKEGPVFHRNLAQRILKTLVELWRATVYLDSLLKIPDQGQDDPVGRTPDLAAPWRKHIPYLMTRTCDSSWSRGWGGGGSSFSWLTSGGRGRQRYTCQL